jgi:hypothetical protein
MDISENSTFGLIYVSVPHNEGRSRMDECDSTAPYSEYSESCTDRSFRIMGIITDETFKARVQEQQARSHEEIVKTVSLASSRKVQNVQKTIAEISHELPTPSTGNISACALYLEHANVSDGSGHTVLVTKNERGELAIDDVSHGTREVGTVDELNAAIARVGYNNNNGIWTTVYEKQPGSDNLSITAVGGRKKTKKTKKYKKYKKTKGSRRYN